MYAKKLKARAHGRHYQSSRSGSLSYRRPRRNARPAKARPRANSRRVFLISLFCLAQVLFFTSELFAIREVSISGATRLGDQAILEQAHIPAGSTFWTVSPSSLQNRLSHLHELAQAQVSFNFPGHLNIAVEERQARYRVAMTAAEPKWLVCDVEGVVLNLPKAPRDLPRILIDAPVIEAARLDAETIFAINESVRWLRGAFQQRPWFYQLDKRQQITVKVPINGRPLVVKVGQVERMDYKVSVLKLLLEKLASEKKTATLIDLRYSSPVVKLEEKKQDLNTD